MLQILLQDHILDKSPVNFHMQILIALGLRATLVNVLIGKGAGIACSNFPIVKTIDAISDSTIDTTTGINFINIL
jgi:hypothetical protein